MFGRKLLRHEIALLRARLEFREKYIEECDKASENRKMEVKQCSKIINDMEQRIRDDEKKIQQMAADFEKERERLKVKPILVTLEEAGEWTPARVKYLLGRIDDGDETYGAILKVIQAQLEVELQVALRPNAGNEDRQYGAGRSAAVTDVLVMLENTRAEGRALAAGEKEAA